MMDTTDTLRHAGIGAARALAELFSYEKELEDGSVIEKDFNDLDYVFFAILVFINFLNLFVIIPLTTVFCRRRCKRRKTAVEAKNSRIAALSDLTPAEKDVTVIVPCYLPNEQTIIEESASHILEKIDTPGHMHLILVYNTPKDLPDIETRLQQLAARNDLPRGRTVSVLRVKKSKSKAENLNTALEDVKTKYVVIYDADHHPDPGSLNLLFEKLIRCKCNCVQGSTYIRNVEKGFVARLVDAEFFVTHFLYFPAMRFLTRTGVFGGSNAMWETDILAGKQFNHDMQTEDIDVSVRSIVDKRKIEFCPEARSGELAPFNLRALYKQRVRWAIGWDQVAIMHWRTIRKSKLPFHKRVGMMHIFYVRWLIALTSIFAGVITPIFGLVWRFEPQVWGLSTVVAQMTLFYFYCFMSTQCVLEAWCQRNHRGRDSKIQVLFVLLFMCCGAGYVAIQGCLIMISMWRIMTGTVGGWVVTARSTADTPKKGAETPQKKPSINRQRTASEEWGPVQEHMCNFNCGVTEGTGTTVEQSSEEASNRSNPDSDRSVTVAAPTAPPMELAPPEKVSNPPKETLPQEKVTPPPAQAPVKPVAKVPEVAKDIPVAAPGPAPTEYRNVNGKRLVAL